MKPTYAKNELLKWIEVIEEAKASGMTPEDFRHYIENERELSA
ncbi:anti-repressor SinI family protein [Rossellomorea marisflavi]|nr:anti-repressor SinI family protein [Rossellomorea marisflavi]